MTTEATAKHKSGQPPPQPERPSAILRWLANVPPLVWVLLLTTACLLPFIHRAFYIDEPLFLRVAGQIQKHPGDFYGFRLNWFRTEEPVVSFFYNPPLACYYLAVAAALGGWSEPALHLAFLLPALALAWGTYSLARLHCRHPLLASVVAVLTPVVLVSATTVMCDIMMLAFWIWALVWFEKGIGKSAAAASGGTAREPSATAAFLASGALAGLAFLTKYPGLMLAPLMLGYGWYRCRRPGWWLTSALLPVLVAVGYELLLQHLYGRGQLLGAVMFSHEERLESGLGSKLLVGLGFAGGCFLPLLFYAPLTWSRRSLLVGVALSAPLVLCLPWVPTLTPFLRPKGHLDGWLWLQGGLFVLAGVHLVALATLDWWQRRDSSSVLLGLWVAGVFIFGTGVNWMINGRSFLAMAPALGILLARRLEALLASTRPRPCVPERQALSPEPGASSFSSSSSLVHKHPGSQRTGLVPLLIAFPLLASLVLSLLVVWADYRAAGAERTAAQELCARYNAPGRTLWFEGHWGFQYYMEQQGAKALDFSRPGVTASDLLIIPNRASGVAPPSPQDFDLIDNLKLRPNSFLSTVNPAIGACFYAARRGPLPYAVGKLKPDYYLVFRPKPGR